VLPVTSLSGLDVYQVAYLCGGPQRVAVAAVATMAEDGRLKISRTRHRVQAVHRWGGQPVERAVLSAVPATGKVLGPLLEDVANSAAVQEMIEGLRRDGLVGQRSLAGHPHLSAAGRAARKDLEDSGARGPGERVVAVLGTAGIGDAGLRGIFETPDPPLGSELPGLGTRKSAARRAYRDIPPDSAVQGYPGISGRW
jgi:hypothetical protein